MSDMTISPEIIKIADNYGVHNQMNKLLEELDELKSPVISAYLDLITSPDIVTPDVLENLIDEMADVTIMIEQVAYLLNITGDVEQRRTFKIDRQLGRMAQEGKQ